MNRTAFGVTAAIAQLGLLGCAGSRPAAEPPQQQQLVRAISPPTRLAPPEYLPESARVVLRTLMPRHAQRMGELMSAVMVLDYDAIVTHAEAAAEETTLARPFTGDATELNSLLPEAFFAFQDELKKHASALATAGRRLDALDVAASYGRLSETCVRCHHTYRTGQ